MGKSRLFKLRYETIETKSFFFFCSLGHDWLVNSVCTCMPGIFVEDCVVSWLVRYMHTIAVTSAHLHNLTWHIWHKLIICGQPLGSGGEGRGFHRSVSHISWARPVCVDSHPSYELRFSMCTFKYSHITSMHPCRNNQNKWASTKYGDKSEGFRGLFQCSCCF